MLARPNAPLRERRVPRGVRRGLNVGVIAAAVLAVGGCGGTSKSGFVAKAESLCQTAQSQATPLIGILSKAANGGLNPGKARRLAPTVQSLYAVGAQLMHGLHALSEPSGDRATIHTFLADGDSVVSALGIGSQSMVQGNVKAVENELSNFVPTMHKTKVAAVAYGMDICGATLSPLG